MTVSNAPTDKWYSIRYDAAPERSRSIHGYQARAGLRSPRILTTQAELESVGRSCPPRGSTPTIPNRETGVLILHDVASPMGHGHLLLEIRVMWAAPCMSSALDGYIYAARNSYTYIKGCFPRPL